MLFVIFPSKIVPEVLAAARSRPIAEVMSPSESATPNLYRWSVENFRLYFSPSKSYSSLLIWLEIWFPGFKIWGFGGFDPEM
jgi:hypothetical protein